MKISALDELHAVWKEQERNKFHERVLRHRKCGVCNMEFRTIKLRKKHAKSVHSY